MKLRKEATFSHPVVSPYSDDAAENRFGFSGFTVRADGLYYHAAAEFELHNVGLLNYIAGSKACFAILIEARNFYYRKLHSPLGQVGELRLDADELSGYVDCMPFVIAAEDIPDYRLPDMNADYGRHGVSIRKGDVLAIGDARMFLAEREFDSLRKLSSIMEVLEDDKVSRGSMDVVLGGDKIRIFVCREDHARYSTLAKLPEVAPVLMQALAVPALQEAIVEMRKSEEGSGQRRWEVALSKRLATMNVDLADSSPADIACRILDGALASSLVTIDRLVSGGDEA